MKKGFTLIELLAVIVILAIILVIAVPSITGIVNNVSKRAFENDAKLMIKAIEYKKMSNNTFDPSYILVSNINDQLNISNENYEAISVNYNANGKADVYIIGKNKWDGLIASGTYNDMTIVSSDDAPNSVFNDYYGGTEQDNFSQIKEISSGGYITVGSSNSTDGDLTGITYKGGWRDAIIVKYNAAGNVVWTKNYGGGDSDGFYNVIVEADGYVAIGGTSSTDGDVAGISKGDSDGIVVKYDANGNILWKKNYGGTRGEEFYGATETADGYILVGQSSSTDGDMASAGKTGYYAFIMKIDNNGNIIWVRGFGGSDNQIFYDVDVTSGGYIAIGSSSSTDGDMAGLNKGEGDGVIVKYDSNGNILWTKSFGGSADDYFLKVLATDAGYVVTGISRSNDVDMLNLSKTNGDEDSVVVKYDLDGNILWIKSYASGYYSWSDVITYNNQYLLLGSLTIIIDEETYYQKARMMALDSSGKTLWDTNFGDNANATILESATVLNNGNLLTISSVWIPAATNNDALIYQFAE